MLRDVRMRLEREGKLRQSRSQPDKERPSVDVSGTNECKNISVLEEAGEKRRRWHDEERYIIGFIHAEPGQENSKFLHYVKKLNCTNSSV